jgi:inhibitor of cysteine peptidase
MCTQIVVPFEESIPLDVVGLPAGTYTVDVNGVTGSFTLDVDNQLPEATP